MAHLPQGSRPLEPAPSGGWALDHAGFEGLLRFLDPDRDRAAARYEDIRRRLTKLFSWRGCLNSDEYVDRTMDRVARRLAEGAEVRVADPYQYVYGVAQNILREHWREPGRRWVVIAPGADAYSQAEDVVGEERVRFERTLLCAEECVARLPARTRALFLAYHAEPGRIARRRALAASLGIPINALRIRVHRIRAAVERCVVACAGPEPAMVAPWRPAAPANDVSDEFAWHATGSPPMASTRK